MEEKPAANSTSDRDKVIFRRQYLSKLAQQVLLNTVFLLMFLAFSLRGPTFLDLQEIYRVSFHTLSLSIVATSVGGILGAVAIGYIWTRFHQQKHIVMFIMLTAMSMFTAAMPNASNIPGFFVVSTGQGMALVAINTVTSVLCLEIWTGFNGSPYMHSLHFCGCLGAFLAPVLSQPFLSSTIYNEKENIYMSSNDSNNNINSIINSSISNNNSNNHDTFTDTAIFYLYPLIGLILLLVSLGYVYLGVLDLIKHKKTKEFDLTTTKAATTTTTTTSPNSKMKLLLVSLICLFLIIFAGIDFSLINYLPAFAVKSKYQLTKKDGVNLLAIYLATNCFSRLLAMALAIKFSPKFLLLFNFLLASVGVIVLFTEPNFLLVQFGYGIVGFGLGSTFPNMWMWMEQYIKVSSKVSGFMSVAGCVGLNIAPLVTGQFLEREPMVLVYLLAGFLGVSVAIFSCGELCGRRILREKEELGREQGDNFS